MFAKFLLGEEEKDETSCSTLLSPCPAAARRPHPYAESLLQSPEGEKEREASSSLTDWRFSHSVSFPPGGCGLSVRQDKWLLVFGTRSVCAVGRQALT